MHHVWRNATSGGLPIPRWRHPTVVFNDLRNSAVHMCHILKLPVHLDYCCGIFRLHDNLELCDKLPQLNSTYLRIHHCKYKTTLANRTVKRFGNNNIGCLSLYPLSRVYPFCFPTYRTSCAVVGIRYA